MDKPLDKQKLLDYLNEQASYFYDKQMIGVSGVFVILRDDIESGRFDLSEESE